MPDVLIIGAVLAYLAVGLFTVAPCNAIMVRVREESLEPRDNYIIIAIWPLLWVAALVGTGAALGCRWGDYLRRTYDEE